MTNEDMVKISPLLKSFRHAWRGMKLVFRTEQNFRIQAGVGAVVVLLLFVFPIPTFQAIVLILLAALVLALEMANSILERLVDTFKPRIHPVIGEIKDMTAAMVLLLSLTALVIGSIIFLPHIFRLFFG